MLPNRSAEIKVLRHEQVPNPRMTVRAEFFLHGGVHQSVELDGVDAATVNAAIHLAHCWAGVSLTKLTFADKNP